MPNTGDGGGAGGGLALGALLVVGLFALSLRVRSLVARRRS